jgi:mannose-6-phosphate isomerase-like protein (cupin superfamily)
MKKSAVAAFGLAMFSVGLIAQTPPVTGDRTSPLRPLGGDNVGISNSVLREQPDVRVLRVVVEPGGQRIMHEHANVQFHMFIPVSNPMELEVQGVGTMDIQPWHPYYMAGGTQHAFHNGGSEAVEIMEVFIN